MSNVDRFAPWLYKLLLRFYPKNHRAEFEEEMQEVFVQTVSEAAEKGTIHLALVTLRELKDYPFNLLREHWLNLQKKEVVMATGSSSMNASVCPRCGILRPTEARYCTNCGRAFIPIHTYVVEQVRNFIESRITLVIFGALALLVISEGGSHLITGGIFYPLSYLILAAGVGVGSSFFGWQLTRKSSNRSRLLLILLVSIYLEMLFFATEEIDWATLRSEVTADQSISYDVLGIQTFVTRLETENKEGMSISSVCDNPNQSCMEWHRRLDENLKRPVILVERSWKDALFYPYQWFFYTYQWLFVGYVLGIGFLAYRTSQRIKRRKLIST